MSTADILIGVFIGFGFFTVALSAAFMGWAARMGYTRDAWIFFAAALLVAVLTAVLVWLGVS